MSGSDINMPTTERQIGDHEYQVTMLPLGRWLEVEGLVIAVFGGPLERFLSALPKGGDLGDLDIADLADAIHGLLRGLSSGDLDKLCQHMGSCARVRRQDGSWELLDRKAQELYWPRNMREMIPTIMMFLEVQFAGFFGGALSALSDVRGVVQPKG